MGLVSLILKGLTAVMEVAMPLHDQGATKKQLILPIATEVVRQLAEAHVLPAALPVDEISTEIDNVVREQNQHGWVDLVSSAKFYVSIADVLALIKAAKGT